MGFIAKDNLSQLAEQSERPTVPLYRYDRFALVVVEKTPAGPQEHLLYEVGGSDEDWQIVRKRYLRMIHHTPYRVEVKLMGLARNYWEN